MSLWPAIFVLYLFRRHSIQSTSTVFTFSSVSLSLSSSIVGSVYNFYVLYYIFRLFFRSWGLFFVNDDVYQYTRGIRSKWWCPVNRTLNYNIYTVAAVAHEIISITFGYKCQNSRYLYKSFKFCNALTFRSLAIYFIIQNICSQLSR
jgi:hypothetical protein